MDHGGKHLKARTCADAKAMSSGGGAAQYNPDTKHGALEKEAIARGQVIKGEPIQDVLHGGTFHTKYDAKAPIGAFNGKEATTFWTRQESIEAIGEGGGNRYSLLGQGAMANRRRNVGASRAPRMHPAVRPG